MDRHVVNTAELREYESLGWLIHVLSNLGDGNIYSGARILYNEYVRLHNRVRSGVPPVVDIDRGLAPHSPARALFAQRVMQEHVPRSEAMVGLLARLESNNRTLRPGGDKMRSVAAGVDENVANGAIVTRRRDVEENNSSDDSSVDMYVAVVPRRWSRRNSNVRAEGSGMRPLDDYFGVARGQEAPSAAENVDMEEDVSDDVIDLTDSVEDAVPDSTVSETVPVAEGPSAIAAESEGPSLESCGFPVQE